MRLRFKGGGVMMPTNAQQKNDSELIIGIITTVGTDISVVKQALIDKLMLYSYIVETIKVSADIISKFEKKAEISKKEKEFERISRYMDIGDELRKTDTTILMKGVASKIFLSRKLTERCFDDGQKLVEASPRERVAYIIDSIKHPDEVDFLRRTYTSGFHLVGVSSDRSKRIKNLIEGKGISEEQAEELLKRDDAESFDYGQKTADAFHSSDYFITAGDSTDEVKYNTYRLLELLFGNPFPTPTFEEYAMFMAYATSLRSADLSRQVGAVITKKEEILSSGANDCPKYGGGLYWPIKSQTGGIEDEKEGRDYTLGYDSNKKEQTKIIENILSCLDIEKTDDNFNKVKKAGISDLTEYGRVVHSEMEALLMCARNNVDSRGAEMFVTTFPCHNCAKHIIAAGISKVHYIEPYPKSKALDFYKSEIGIKDNEEKKVKFIPFSGVGPRKYIDLFAVNSSLSYQRIRKDKDGNNVKWGNEQANLRNPIGVLNYLDNELAAHNSFEKTLNKI